MRTTPLKSTVTKTLLLAAAALLSACATGPSPLAQRLSATPAAEHAYILGTYVVTCKPSGSNCAQSFNSLSTYFRSSVDKQIRGSLNSTSGSMFGNDTVPDFVNETAAEKGFQFCMALPPGDYEFYSYNFYSFAGGGSGFSIPEKNEFSIPFSIAPGELLNLGRLKLTTTTGQNIFGMSLPAPGFLIVSPPDGESLSDQLKKCPEQVRQRSVRSIDLGRTITKASPLVQTLPAR